jgi:hypothetical protein
MWTRNYSEEEDEYRKITEVPIVYDAHTLNRAQQRYPTYKKELFAIVHFTTKSLESPDDIILIMDKRREDKWVFGGEQRWLRPRSR